MLLATLRLHWKIVSYFNMKISTTFALCAFFIASPCLLAQESSEAGKGTPATKKNTEEKKDIAQEKKTRASRLAEEKKLLEKRKSEIQQKQKEKSKTSRE